MNATVILALLLAGQGAGQSVGQGTAPLVALPVTAPEPAPHDDLLAFETDQLRMTVPVSIGDQGPFGFIVDTGSERTVISRELAGRLGLAEGPRIHVTAMANSADVGTVIVPSLQVSRIARRRIEAPALAGAHLGAAGMLGIDALQGHAVSIDFDRNEMTLRPSRQRVSAPALPDEIVVRAKSLYGQLIVTDARINGHRIAVVIDTGSAVTVANGALLHMLKRPPRALGKTSLLSVTGAWLQADMAVIDRIGIGQVEFTNVPLAFAEAKPFARFHLTDAPALMLGMDVLRLFRRVQIDFANREVRFTLPRGMERGFGIRTGSGS